MVPVAVALDTGGVRIAGEWIRAAEPTYPCLIDERHVVAELFGMRNVPSAVWVDERGRVVRPSENCGSSDAWRFWLDRGSGKMAPEGVADAGRAGRSISMPCETGFARVMTASTS